MQAGYFDTDQFNIPVAGVWDIVTRMPGSDTIKI